MSDGNHFFDHPTLNSPYGYPARTGRLDSQGQPTQNIVGHPRVAEFITPIPKPKKRKGTGQQSALVFDERRGQPRSRLRGREGGLPVRTAHKEWYRKLFSACVAASLISGRSGCD
jgi:hypothetical protein